MHNQGRITQLFKAVFVITGPAVKASQQEPNVKYINMWFTNRGIDHFCIMIFIFFKKKTQLKSSDIWRTRSAGQDCSISTCWMFRHTFHLFFLITASRDLDIVLVVLCFQWPFNQLCSHLYNCKVHLGSQRLVVFGLDFCSVETSSTQIMTINTHTSNTRCEKPSEGFDLSTCQYKNNTSPLKQTHCKRTQSNNSFKTWIE